MIYFFVFLDRNIGPECSVFRVQSPGPGSSDSRMPYLHAKPVFLYGNKLHSHTYIMTIQVVHLVTDGISRPVKLIYKRSLARQNLSKFYSPRVCLSFALNISACVDPYKGQKYQKEPWTTSISHWFKYESGGEFNQPVIYWEISKRMWKAKSTSIHRHLCVRNILTYNYCYMADKRGLQVTDLFKTCRTGIFELWSQSCTKKMTVGYIILEFGPSEAWGIWSSSETTRAHKRQPSDQDKLAGLHTKNTLCLWSRTREVGSPTEDGSTPLVADLGTGAKGPWPPPVQDIAPTSGTIKDYLYSSRSRATCLKPHFLCFASPHAKSWIRPCPWQKGYFSLSCGACFIVPETPATWHTTIWLLDSTECDISFIVAW